MDLNKQNWIFLGGLEDKKLILQNDRIVCELASAIVLKYEIKNSLTTSFKSFCFVIVPSTP